MKKVVSSMNTKDCDTCGNPGTVMYRIQIRKGKKWIFVCPDCQKIHAEGSFYRYGGTWKGYRH